MKKVLRFVKFGGGGKPFTATVATKRELQAMSLEELNRYYAMPNREEFWNNAGKLNDFRITSMTASEFEAFLDLARRAMNVAEPAQAEWVADCIRNGRQIVYREDIENFVPIKAADMCCRWGRWEEAAQFIEEGERLGMVDQGEAGSWKDAIPKRKEAVSGLVSLLRQSAEPVKQNALKKLCGDLDPESVTWALRYFKGIKREKAGSSYVVSLSGEQGVAL